MKFRNSIDISFNTFSSLRRATLVSQMFSRSCVIYQVLFTQVGWVKADTKAIQAIHDHVITHNPRVSVSHNDHSTWNLHIRNVQEEDRGQYMCQINTDPMKSQVNEILHTH